MPQIHERDYVNPDVLVSTDGLSANRRELGEVKAGRSAALPHLIGETSSHGDQRRRVDAPVGRREAP